MKVPEWLVSFVVGIMIPWVLEMVMVYMRTTFRESGSEYMKRMRSGVQPLYNAFQQRVNSFLKRCNSAPADVTSQHKPVAEE